MRMKLKYIKSDKDRHGNERFYFRKDRSKPTIRLPSDVKSPEFLVAYNKALSGSVSDKMTAKKLPSDSLEWLVRRYFDSAEFSQLDPTTQRTRRGILNAVCIAYGEKPYARLKAKHIRALRDEKRDTPQAANVRLVALKQVFKHAFETGLMDTNPTIGVPKFKTKGSGFHSWSLEEVERFEEKHPVGTKARLAMALLLYTAQRRSDVVLMGRQHIRDGWLTLTQHKNRNKSPTTVSIPVIPELRQIIDESSAGEMTFLITGYGKSFSSAGFSNWFRDRCDEAGLKHCSAHGLRKAAAARLAEKGCSATEIMSITGHRSLTEVQRYVAAAQQKIMAKSAMEKLIRE